MNPQWHVDTDSLPARLRSVRQFTESLCEPLEPEDFVVQSMTEASPAKWHLAHSSWFFDAFVFEELLDQAPIDDTYNYLFNSYYNSAGDQYARPDRGLLSRPTVEQVFEYRHAVDEHLNELFADKLTQSELARRLELGLHHEQQHQELLLTDLKHMFSHNPLAPEVYSHAAEASKSGAPALSWSPVSEGTYTIGHAGDDFAYDSEAPAHSEYLRAYEIANRPVTCGEFIEFIEDDGYERVELWHSDGWQAVQQHKWDSPLYWQHRDGEWHQYTLGGLRPVDPNETLAHVSFYEAAAFAKWARHHRWDGARLPTEAEWEVALGETWRTQDDEHANTAESSRLHPDVATQKAGETPFYQPFGTVWEWTSSAFSPYPGFEAWDGGIGEYNGKFMVNQYVLRGGSCATPKTHIRPTYRNFFYPGARWQFSGIRLARDLE